MSESWDGYVPAVRSKKAAVNVTSTDAGKFCPACGYDLRGITSERCPECGIVPGAAAVTIPWLNRQEIGHLKAFWGTVVLATFRPQSLAAGSGPVDYTSGRRFRWIVVTLGSFPPILLLLAAVWQSGGTGFLSAVGTDPEFLTMPLTLGQELAIFWSAGATLLPVLPIGAIATLLLWSTAAAHWCRPAHLEINRQNRAVAISQYACGPLAWAPLAVLAWLAVTKLTSIGYVNDTPPLLVWIQKIALAVCILVACWRAALSLLARTTHCGIGRLAAAAIGVPLSWALSAAIGLGVLPALVGFVWIVIDGFR